MSLSKITVAQSTATPGKAFEGLLEKKAIHGLTDGTWNFIDSLRELIRIIGPAYFYISTWTAAKTNLDEVFRFMSARSVLGMKLLVDRSFLTRKPDVCRHAIKLFGKDCIRIWNSHAKFAVVSNDKHRILYLTSANLNPNIRIESYSIYHDHELATRYQQMVESLFEKQSTDASSVKSRRDSEVLLREFYKDVASTGKVQGKAGS